MAKVDLSKMSSEELREMTKQAAQELSKREKAERKAVYDEMAALAKKAGTTPEDLVAEFGKKRRSKGKAPAKYRNPNDASQTWSGMGPTPKWMRELLDKGKKKEDLAI